MEIKENLNEQAKIKVYEKNLQSLTEIIDVSNIMSLYDNNTYSSIVKNENFVYIKKELYLISLQYTKLYGNGKDITIPYNINNNRQPEILSINVKPIFEIELEEGFILVSNLLDNVYIL